MKLLKEEQLRAPVLSPGCNVHNAPPSGALTMRASLSRGVRGDIEGGLHHRVSSFPCRIYLCTKSVDVSRTANLDFLFRRFALTPMKATIFARFMVAGLMVRSQLTIGTS